MKYFFKNRRGWTKGEIVQKGVGFVTLTCNFYKKTKILKYFPIFLNSQNYFLEHKISIPFSQVETKLHIQYSYWLSFSHISYKIIFHTFFFLNNLCITTLIPMYYLLKLLVLLFLYNIYVNQNNYVKKGNCFVFIINQMNKHGVSRRQLTETAVKHFRSIQCIQSNHTNIVEKGYT